MLKAVIYKTCKLDKNDQDKVIIRKYSPNSFRLLFFWIPRWCVVLNNAVNAVNFETDAQPAGPATYIMVPVPETTTENVPIWPNCNIYRNFVNVTLFILNKNK